MLLLRSQLPLDALIRSLAPAAWFRQGVGITVTGSGVSQWDDQSGNGRHLLQGTDSARPMAIRAAVRTALSAGDTFTRATTATVEDWEGAIRVCKSGEVRFPGARRVENLALYSSLNSAGASVGSAGGTTPPTITATTFEGQTVESVVFPAGGSGYAFSRRAGSGSAEFTKTTTVVWETTRRYTWRVRLALSRQLVGSEALVLYVTGNAGMSNPGITLNSSLCPTTLTDLAKVADAPMMSVTGSNGLYAYIGSALSTPITLYLERFQIEEVTGQSNQNPSEYVSVGVLSSPFHGAMVDGVKYFEHQNGNTVASNVVTEATGATLTTCKGQLYEPASTNLVLQSSNFGTTWAAVGSPTRSAAAAYCGSIALDLIGDDDAGNLEGYTQSIAFTGDAVKSVSFLVKQGTSTSTVVRLRDTTAGADRLLAAVTWSGGVPVVTYTTGSSERASEALADGVYRVYALTSSVTAANTNSLQFYPASDAALATTATGTVYIGGVQAENALFASSHIPTTTGTVTRNADYVLMASPDAIYTDGVARYAKTGTFTLNQPVTRYIVFQSPWWASGRYIADGNAANSGAVLQTGTYPQVSINAGATVAPTTGLAIGSHAVLCVQLNGASSLTQVNTGSAVTGNAGAGNMGAITVGASGAGANFGPAFIYEDITFAAAHGAEVRARIIAGLMARHGVA